MFFYATWAVLASFPDDFCDTLFKKEAGLWGTDFSHKYFVLVLVATPVKVLWHMGVYGSHGQKRDERCASKAPMSKEAIGAASSTAPPV